MNKYVKQLNLNSIEELESIWEALLLYQPIGSTVNNNKSQSINQSQSKSRSKSQSQSTILITPACQFVTQYFRLFHYSVNLILPLIN